jgi:hypothetical protein
MASKSSNSFNTKTDRLGKYFCQDQKRAEHPQVSEQGKLPSPAGSRGEMPSLPEEKIRATNRVQNPRFQFRYRCRSNPLSERADRFRRRRMRVPSFRRFHICPSSLPKADLQMSVSDGLVEADIAPGPREKGPYRWIPKNHKSCTSTYCTRIPRPRPREPHPVARVKRGV